MNILNRLLGRDDPDETRRPVGDRQRAVGGERFGEQRSASSSDEQAIERYRYLLRTAPPETVEEAHAEAFAQLTPEQRRMVLQELTQALPERERAADYDEDPRSLARMATRAEMRQPGTLERTFGGMNAPGMGMGGMLAGGFLGSFAGIMVGSMVAQSFFNDSGSDQGSGEGSDAAESADAGQDAGGAEDNTADAGGGFGDDFGGDLGGDLGGDFGGDF